MELAKVIKIYLETNYAIEAAYGLRRLWENKHEADEYFDYVLGYIHKQLNISLRDPANKIGYNKEKKKEYATEIAIV